MLLITPVVIGIVVGIAMAVVFKRYQYIPHNIIYGLIGALVLRLLTYLVLASHYDVHSGFSLIDVFSSFMGALLFTYVPKLFPPIIPIGSDDKEDYK